MALDDGSSSFRDLYRKLHTTVVLVGAAFVLVALLVSLWLILQHLRSYSNPEEQKWIIAVLFMVPVYASESEENGKEELTEQLLEGQDKAQARNRSRVHIFFWDPNALGERLYTIIKFGLVQYMILKSLCAFLSFILELFGVYGDGEFKWYYGYPYIAVVINFSQTWALYCLVKFYNATHEKLQEIRPLAKFISFKAIVFATWWQGLGIAIICHIGILPKEGKVQNAIQDFLICIEMAIAAVAHAFVFNVEPYQHIPLVEHGEITCEESKLEVKVDSDDDSSRTPTTVEEKETHVEAPGTSIKESVQDVVIGGGHHVVQDVALTISQAIGPVEKGVEKGVGKIQDTFHHISLKPKGKEEPEVKVEEHITENTVDGEPVAVDAEVEVERTVQDDNSKEGESLMVNREVAIERTEEGNKSAQMISIFNRFLLTWPT
uniref:Protein LAZ1 homolog 2 n=1 Tax=Oryza punctata TaxID=4537 RepID=A0A0E0KEW9_ORYPU